jgi:hypothetical protein
MTTAPKACYTTPVRSDPVFKSLGQRFEIPARQNNAHCMRLLSCLQERESLLGHHGLVGGVLSSNLCGALTLLTDLMTTQTFLSDLL